MLGELKKKKIERTDRTEREIDRERGEKNQGENYKNSCGAKEFWENQGQQSIFSILDLRKTAQILRDAL